MRSLVELSRWRSQARTREIDRVDVGLEQLRRGYHHRIAHVITTGALDAAARLPRGGTTARARVAKSRTRWLRIQNRDITDLTRRISAAAGATLGRIEVVAADIPTEAGDPTELATEAAFAMANGTAPIEASSGRTARRRLHRSGNCQPTKAIHAAEFAQFARRDTGGRVDCHRCPD